MKVEALVAEFTGVLRVVAKVLSRQDLWWSKQHNTKARKHRCGRLLHKRVSEMSCKSYLQDEGAAEAGVVAVGTRGRKVWMGGLSEGLKESVIGGILCGVGRRTAKLCLLDSTSLNSTTPNECEVLQKGQKKDENVTEAVEGTNASYSLVEAEAGAAGAHGQQCAVQMRACETARKGGQTVLLGAPRRFHAISAASHINHNN